MRNVTIALALFAALFLVVGCGAKKEGEGAKAGEGGAAKPEPKPAPKPGGETPEEAFEVLKTSFGENGKWGDCLGVFTPKQKNVFPLMMVISASFTMAEAAQKHEGVKEEFEKTLADVGLKAPEGEKNLIDLNALETPEATIAEADRVFKDRDAAKILNAVQPFVAKYDKGKEFATAFSGISDVKIEGDKATGQVSMGKEKKAMSFEKIDGRWYIEIQSFFK